MGPLTLCVDRWLWPGERLPQPSTPGASASDRTLVSSARTTGERRPPTAGAAATAASGRALEQAKCPVGWARLAACEVGWAGSVGCAAVRVVPVDCAVPRSALPCPAAGCSASSAAHAARWVARATSTFTVPEDSFTLPEDSSRHSLSDSSEGLKPPTVTPTRKSRGRSSAPSSPRE